jgi:hypothetical protein
MEGVSWLLGNIVTDVVWFSLSLVRDFCVQNMSEEGFKEHVEALATKRLEKPKKLSARNGRYWSEILSQHYNFHRDQLEVRHSLLGVGDVSQRSSQH